MNFEITDFFLLLGIFKVFYHKKRDIGVWLLLSDGSYAKIEEIYVEKLDTPETTYNFEVADYHTYYVANNKVLVHNKCWEWGKGSYSSPEESLRIHYEDHHVGVGAKNIDQYLQMAKDYADDVVNNGGKFIKKVPGATKNVQRYTMGDNLYIDIVKKTKTIISFGELW